MKSKPRRRRVLRRVLLGLLCVLLIAIAGATWWLRPFPASAQAMDALRNGNGVTITTTNDDIVFMPTQHPTEGIIFYPGARVDPDAYARYMRTFAEHGYAAFIVKMPLNIALLGENLASNVIAANPSIKIWVIGGHSLGGVSACSFALHNSVIKGILLYASYPSEDLSKQTRLHITSISGANDGLATPAKIVAAKPLLPKTTVYVTVQGGIHAFFGDYGPQDGDGQPSTSREIAHKTIADASVKLLDSVKADNNGVMRGEDMTGASPVTTILRFPLSSFAT